MEIIMRENIPILLHLYNYVLQASGGPNKEKDEHYLPLDHKKGGKGVGSKDKPSGTQGGEYGVLGNSKVRKNPTM